MLVSVTIYVLLTQSELGFGGGGGGGTKAPFVNFSVSKIFDLAQVPLRLFESHSYLSGSQRVFW